VTAAETADITPTVTTPKAVEPTVDVPTTTTDPSAFPTVVDAEANTVQVAATDFVAALVPIENGSNVAVDFGSAIPADQDPADMTLVAAIESDDGTTFNQVTEDEFNALMAAGGDTAAEDAPADEPAAADTAAAVAPVVEAAPVVILPPQEPPFFFDFSAMFSFPEPMAFWRRRLAAVDSPKGADVFYFTKVTGSKGASFKVDVVFSDPSAVKKAKVSFTLEGKNGFKAKIGVPLPAQFKDKSSASTGQMFADIVLALFVINMFMVALSSGW